MVATDALRCVSENHHVSAEDLQSANAHYYIRHDLQSPVHLDIP
jgi:hypothetical protein